MNILVTSGGTTENIDSVRSITNISTGKLGSLIAERFAAESNVEKIFYICSRKAFKPQTEKLETVYVTGVSSLESAVKEVTMKTDIDIIIHSMAVSDYRVKSVTSAANLAALVYSNLGSIKESEPEAAKTALASMFGKAESLIHGDGKISSGVDDMILFMEKTPKIISLFQTLAPKATLTGFKLLNNVPRETLIEKGFQILIQNKCSFVLANDLKDIKGERHTGYLIGRDKSCAMYETKTEIAGAIVRAAMLERKERI